MRRKAMVADVSVFIQAVCNKPPKTGALAGRTFARCDRKGRTELAYQPIVNAKTNIVELEPML